MTVTMTRSAGTRVVRHPAQRFNWPATLALHLLPTVAAFALAASDLPPQFALAVIPLQLGLLLHAAHRVTGRWSLMALPSVLSFRRRLPSRMYLMLLPSLFAVALGVAMLLDVEHGWAWLLPVAGLQEVYFRAYLLPRLPVGGAPAILVSAVLSALPFAFGGPFAFMLVMHLVLTAVTVRLDSVRVSIAAHCLLALAVLVV